MFGFNLVMTRMMRWTETRGPQERVRGERVWPVMLEHDLTDALPDSANVIEVRVELDHPQGLARIFRAPDDLEPIAVTGGSTARIGIGASRVIYVEVIDPATTCTVEVVYWSD